MAGMAVREFETEPSDGLADRRFGTGDAVFEAEAENETEIEPAAGREVEADIGGGDLAHPVGALRCASVDDLAHGIHPGPVLAHALGNLG